MFTISVLKVVENSFTSLFNMSAILWLMFYSVSQTLTASAPAPEDWVSGSPFSHFSSEDNRADIIVGAYFNITTFDSNTNMWLWDKTEVGRYGGGHVGPAFGEVIHVTNGANQADHSGCQRPFFSSRGGPPPTNHPWIALIKRGRCNFEVKVENAFLSSASGVIVYNDRESSTLDKMKLSSDSGRNISAVFTHKWKGEEIARIIENNHKVYIHISVASQKSSRTANINRTSVLFVSITFIVLMIISLAWLVFYYVQRFRYIHAKDRLSRRLGNAAKKALSKIPTKNIKSEDKEIQGDGECCAICIEPYKLGDILRSLPCSHEFHKNCIDPWLLEHRTCPMCKMDILKHYGFVFTGSQESILQIDGEEVLNLNQENAAPRRNGVSPLPEIHAVIIANHQMLFDNVSADDESSGASTPNEMTPSLPRHFGGSSDICVSCIAAHTIAVSSENINKTSSNSNVSDVLERQSNISDNVNT